MKFTSVALTALAALSLSAPSAEVAAQKSTKDNQTDKAASEQKKAKPKPPLQRLRQTTDGFAYEVEIKPGVPEPGETVSLELDVAKILETPHPRYGDRRPVENANVVITVVGPTPEGKNERWVDARQAVALSDPGNFGATFTAAAKGVYAAYIQGESKRAGRFGHSFALPYGVWPVPEDTELPAIPETPPQPVPGDLAGGKNLCAQYCRTDVAAARPRGETPEFLQSAVAAAQTDAALLKTMAGDSLKQLSRPERINLLYYLRNLHMGVADFFPKATAYMAHPFTIDDYGRSRLEDAGYPVDDADKTGTVFIVYGDGDAVKRPKLIDYDDTIARDRLDKKNRLGYIVFSELEHDAVAELAIVMDREPKYGIRGLSARAADGSVDSRLNAALSQFEGQGEFNKPKSIRGGPRPLRQKLVPAYLRAAELATMYYGAEREFTQFDDMFGE